MDIVNVVAGPLIGSMIGYVTNHIAVKMLFRPLNPIKIGNLTLPFTPGIFPKRKEQLAKALGHAVGNSLLTSEDVENMLLSDNMKMVLVKEISALLYAEDAEHTIRNMLAGYVHQDDYQGVKEQLENMISEKIMTGLSKRNIAAIIAEESGRAIKEKTQGTILAKMVNDKLILKLTVPIGQKVEEYVNENGLDIIRSIIRDEVRRLENQPIGKLVTNMGMKEEHLPLIIEKIYTVFLQGKIGEFLKQFDIAAVVEQKVNDMNVLEIEKLVLSVMKKELRAIVNLGALIGFLIGLVNIFV